MQWSKRIVPRQIRSWWRDWEKSRSHEQANRQRRQVVEQLIEEKGLTQRRRDDIRHVLFVVVDCLRRDHVSCYGYTRKTTPFVDSLAEQGCLFRETISPSCWTYPSVSSILSGLYPHNHGGVFVEDLRKFSPSKLPRKVRENVIFLPEILNYFGFATYFSSNILPAELAVFGRFQHVNLYNHQRKNAKYILRHYLDWLRAHQKMKTFSYLQLGDLHTKIRVKDPYRSAFGVIPDIPKLERFDYNQRDTICKGPDFERYRENRIKLYDAALFYVDDQLRECFRQLERLKLINKMLVVITADHGEELWDHLQVEQEHFFSTWPSFGVAHGHHLWQEIIGVPLLVLGPEITAQDVYRRISLVDLMPTVLKTCGIRGWEAMDLDGQDLFGCNKTDKRVIFSEDVVYGYEKKAVFEGKYKLYYSQGDGVRWIFDLENDPHEKSALDLPEVADRLVGFIPERGSKKVEEKLSIDEETKKQLRDLGYIE